MTIKPVDHLDASEASYELPTKAAQIRLLIEEGRAKNDYTLDEAVLMSFSTEELAYLEHELIGERTMAEQQEAKVRADQISMGFNKLIGI